MVSEVFGVPTLWLYLGLIGLVALERLVELRISLRNARAAFDAGGKEYGQGHYPVMVLLHTGFLFACPLEVWLFDRPFIPLLAGAMAVVLVGTMALRYWAIHSLAGRWNTRVIVVPGATAVAAGPYRFLRHPNYVAVVLELVALPLFHTAWATAAVVGLANLALLRVRIRVEEAALVEHASYASALGDRPRFLPEMR